MSIVMKNCERCNKSTGILIISMFNTEEICLKCKQKEKEHPDYKKAVKADEEAIRRGNYNFKGIGKPNDLN